MLDTTKKNLLRLARKRHGKIQPCGESRSWEECFTVEHNRLLLWYDTPRDRSTHMVSAIVFEKPEAEKKTAPRRRPN